MSTSSRRPRHPQHPRRIAGGLAGLLVLALTPTLLGGCTVTAGNSERDSQRAAAEKILGDGLQVDLTHPPTRADLGLADGDTSTVLQRRDRAPFEVTVRFADGHRLRTTGVAAVVTSPGPEDAPTSLTVRRDGLSLDDLQATLDGAVTDLGADRSRADAVLDQSRSATSGSADVVRSLPTAVAEPDRLDVESVVTAGEGRVSVNYLLGWGAR